jgi:hypothetical protein
LATLPTPTWSLVKRKPRVKLYIFVLKRLVLQCIHVDFLRLGINDLLPDIIQHLGPEQVKEFAAQLQVSTQTTQILSTTSTAITN